MPVGVGLSLLTKGNGEAALGGDRHCHSGPLILSRGAIVVSSEPIGGHKLADPSGSQVFPTCCPY